MNEPENVMLNEISQPQNDDDGQQFLYEMRSHMNDILNNPSWVNFFKDMTGMEINNEKRN